MYERMMAMKRMEIFEQNMCCDSGFCGTGYDAELQRISDAIQSLRSFQVNVKRYQPSIDSAKFTDNFDVNIFINEHGMEGCPIIAVDGKIVLSGRYPTDEEFADLLDVPKEYVKVKFEDRSTMNNIVDGIKGCGCFDGSCR